MAKVNTGKLGKSLGQALISGGAGYGLAVLFGKLAAKFVPSMEYNLVNTLGRASAALGAGYMAAKGKLKKLPVNLNYATVGAAVATGAKALDMPQLADARMAIDKVFGGDEIVIPVRSAQDAMRVARVMQGQIAFAGGPASVAFAGDDLSSKNDNDPYGL